MPLAETDALSLIAQSKQKPSNEIADCFAPNLFSLLKTVINDSSSLTFLTFGLIFRSGKRKVTEAIIWEKDMNSRRSRAALFDGIEEGGVRAYSSSSHEIDENSNDRAMEGLQDRVNFLKRLTGDIHEEVQNHNRMLDRMGNDMDSSRGILSGTVDRFKTVFETKSGRRMATLVSSFLALFLLIYYMTR
ncbi:hypothetical protein LUZ63_015031 [Rhynchospora breviuscula]|uniref:t-SNARE coiled-coil homology domain-containing protein n=1 Tax=Rhynchospora breviuscula TaxID=2022672 RepID=A0A9Q0CBK3_9POAL|nr:hypothetical protein LUZ63_015031 [Rhynchospora breviuscula]